MKLASPVIPRSIAEQIATELQVKSEQVSQTITLLDDGATVPFIARYRKEVTGGLTDTQLRDLQERLIYLRELQERRETILSNIREQNKLTPELEQTILAVNDKASLEDIYLPYKPKRHTKAQIAKEAGLLPLADGLLQDPMQQPEILALQFLNPEKNITDVTMALDGARQILMERFAEHAEILGQLRTYLWQHWVVESTVIEGKQQEGAKFKDYFDYREALKAIPSHRALAVLRGRRENVLRVQLVFSEPAQEEHVLAIIKRYAGIADQNRPADAWLATCVQWTWKIKLSIKLELELINQLREQADTDAIAVFASNLKDLLMAAPAGTRVTMGLDPGLRTGVKVAIVNNTGALLSYTSVFPHAPRNDWDASIDTLAKLCEQHHVDLISIGNGTASRETDKLALELIKKHPALRLTKIVVSEAGASVYSASALAAEEFPNLDVSYRGAVSIARRLQDPLAELVKIEPKSIGVGQYQHDVSQVQLARSLDGVVEDCVNAVGVDVNTASPALLAHISGLNATLARNIVAHRETHGLFKTRDHLKEVPRLGEKTFEQAAGFLRIINGENALDASSVHPEAYLIVTNILEKNQLQPHDLIGNKEIISRLRAADYVTPKFGIPTISDIFKELEKPGRDPRPEFKTAQFKEGIETIGDLKPDLILEGVVTNVTNFGAFVDVGVHQDGLVHLSALANRFVKDAREVVKVGDIVKVKVLEVDAARKRISLTMRLTDDSATSKLSSGNANKRSSSDLAAGKSRSSAPSFSSSPGSSSKGYQASDRKPMPTQKGSSSSKGRLEPATVGLLGSKLAEALKKN